MMSNTEKGKKSSVLQASLVMGVCLLLVSNGAHAAITDVGDGLCTFFQMLTGKWMFSIGVLSILVAGVAIIMGGEMTDGMKKTATVVMVIGMVMAAPLILTHITGNSNSCVLTTA